MRYFRKFHGPVAAGVLRLALISFFAGEWLLEGGKRILGSRPELRRQRMAAYGQVCRALIKADS